MVIVARKRSTPAPTRDAPDRSGQAGASLIEIVIATLILSFVAVGMAEFFARGRTGFDLEEHKRAGILLAQEALERTVTQPYPQIGPWGEQRTIASVVYVVTVTTQTDVPESDIKTVRCDVTWNATSTTTRTATLATFVYDN